MKKVLLAMSGGVDSSYVAYLLARAGADIKGVYLKLHDRANYHEKNIANVAKVASELGFAYEVLDFSQRFDELVFQPFLRTYEAGRTPNPCALCNRFIKLGALLDIARENERTLVTGHYAKKGLFNGKYRIVKAKDLRKDQSYFLAGINPNALENVEFLLGDEIKSELKAKALKIELLKEISEQKESSEICFVSTEYTDVLKKHLPIERPGIVRDLAGNAVGEHKGYMHYTVGKRRGFSVRGALQPHFVLKINAQENEIIVGSKEDLLTKEFELENLNAFESLPSTLKSRVKIRYNSGEIDCELNTLTRKVSLAEPVYGIASGQLAVFYENESVIASGFIK